MDNESIKNMLLDIQPSNLEFTVTMTGKESSFVIPQKNLQQETLALTASQVKIVRTVVIYIIPLLVVVAGVIVFIRRKNR